MEGRRHISTDRQTERQAYTLTDGGWKEEKERWGGWGRLGGTKGGEKNSNRKKGR